MKSIFRAFLSKLTFQRQLGVTMTVGILCMAFFSSLLISWQGNERVRRSMIEQGQRITESLARQSTLALLYASEDNAADAVNATLAFPGVESVEIRDASDHVLLTRVSDSAIKFSGESAGKLSGEFAVKQDSAPSRADKKESSAVLSAENEIAWKFVAPVLSQPTAESPFQMQEPVRELLGHVTVVVSKAALTRMTRDIFTVNMASSFSFALLFLFLIRFLTNRMTRPLRYLSGSMARAQAGESNVRAKLGGPQDIADMANAFNSMMTVLEQRETQLRQLNETLEQRVIEIAVKSREKDHMLIQQSRLAAVGEMIGNIAHQWRQPINALTLLLVNIKDAFAHDELDQRSLDQSVNNGQAIIQRMSTTIDDFRNFFRPNKEKALFRVKDTVADVMRIMEAAFKHSNIGLSVQGSENVVAYGFRNEYSQVLINLLANAKEAIQEKKIADGQIRVTISQQENMSVVVVEDNAGGIPPDVLPRVFDPYFTTKDTGTGIGLYMSKVIIETNMGGHIGVSNIEGGARFTIITPAR